ncbi:hypothetical protein K504DRAFT_18469 [Pleomassaria siparia CBS 279.74]|uniref:Uncharacterized protein n=1 Tax=Pleomassaria siparia CBS 279.74 TaxID=1314801 RepID=A0A6G1KQG0_9PLEO|nr:hypothetical protein K504DRAFT_18469 [Pleomassaria siparia CBS 279.74]
MVVPDLLLFYYFTAARITDCTVLCLSVYPSVREYCHLKTLRHLLDPIRTVVRQGGRVEISPYLSRLTHNPFSNDDR